MTWSRGLTPDFLRDTLYVLVFGASAIWVLVESESSLHGAVSTVPFLFLLNLITLIRLKQIWSNGSIKSSKCFLGISQLMRSNLIHIDTRFLRVEALDKRQRVSIHLTTGFYRIRSEVIEMFKVI